MLHAIRRFWLLLGLVYVFATLLTIHGTEAITFSKGAPQVCDVVVDGEISKGDFEVFVTQYNDSKFESVCLNSPGGSYFEGIKIARFVNDTRITTRVRVDGECYSACAIIFMAGVAEVGDFEFRDRTLEPGGIIGFHAPYPLIAEGKFDAKQVKESFASAMAEAGDLVGFSGSFDSEPTRPPGGKELSAILPRPLLAQMLRKGPDDVYVIKTIGDAILAGINIDTHHSSRGMSVDDAVHIAENFEYAETLGYTTWHKRKWETDFVKRHLGKRFAFLDRGKAVVMPFYDGIFSYAYIISPDGCCENNLNRDIFRISRIDVNYDWDDSTLNYVDGISKLLGSTPLSLSETWDRGERSGASTAGWTPTWYRFSLNKEINTLRSAPEYTISDPPTIEQDLNLHARDKSTDAALGIIARDNNYIVVAPGIRFLGSPNGGELKEPKDICVKSCRTDNMCRGFQYNLEYEKCQLFRDIYKSLRDPRFYSGAKAPNNIIQENGNVTYRYINYKHGDQSTRLGNAITISGKIRTIGDCEKLCTEAFDCGSFDFGVNRIQEAYCSFYEGGQYFRRNLSQPIDQPTRTGLKLQRQRD